MNVSEFRIAFIDVGEDCVCWFYDDKKNQYFDDIYTGDYSVGDVVRVSWDCFDGVNRVVSSVEKIA